MRLLHAVAEKNASGVCEPITTVALYTDPDRDALYVRESDEAFHLGPATFADPADGSRRSTYLDLDRIEEALVATRADAAWVGWGFAAESPALASLCDRLGITFIGPPADVMAALGDKIRAKQLAEAADVPVAAWSGGPVDSPEAARLHAGRLGLPVVIKASAGGGGRGIRLVRDLADIDAAFTSARAEAEAAFGDPTVFVEKMIEGARHVEVQVVADDAGTVWACGVRDCSVQRKNQKVLEESSSPALPPHLEVELREAAARLCRLVGYRNAGTVEFLYHEATSTVAFMEVNTRLQVEHPVTELVTGLDLVKLQLRIASGRLLPSEQPSPMGHAVEVRLCAEDPDRDFAPAPGRITRFRLPTGPGIRVDTGFREGDVVPADFDSMIAKIQAWGRDRVEALGRLRKALRACQVVVEGGTTNKAFLADLLDTDEVRSGRVDVGWLDRRRGRPAPARPHAEVALVVAGIEAYEQGHALDRARFLAAAFRGRPHVPDSPGFSGELRLGGHTYRLSVRKCGPSRYRVEVLGAEVAADVRFLDDFERRVTIGGVTRRVLVAPQGPDTLVEVDGAAHRVNRDDGGVVRAPAPAVVVAVLVQTGQVVAPGDHVAVVESMKTETAVAAPFAGTVRAVFTSANAQVDAGAPLVQIEPSGTAGDPVDGPPLDPAVLAASTTEPVDGRVRVELLKAMVLGYDVTPADVPPPESLQDPHRRRALERAEDEVLAIFADLAALGRPRRDAAEAADVEAIRSSQQYFFTYLRSIDTEGAGLPEGVIERIRAALSHYDVDDLTRTRSLEDALFWIASAHQRMDSRVGALSAILERRLAEHPQGQAASEGFRLLLDRLVDATRRSFPGLHELAREVRYRLCDEPLVAEHRNATYAEIDEHIEALVADPLGPDRDAHLAALVDCPLPLRARITARVVGAAGPLRDALVEALCRRYYRDRDLGAFTFPDTGHATAQSEYMLDGTRVHVIVAVAADTGFFDAAQRLVPLLDGIPDADDVVVDFHLVRTRRALPTSRVRGYARVVLDKLRLPRPLRRIVVMIAPADTDAGTQQYLTFRPTVVEPAGKVTYREDELTRGLHPMIAKRLDLWRLANFHTERLAWFEDVVVFRAEARDNTRDVRLFALAEVRDLTPILDDAGRLVSLPELERVLMSCLEAIRFHQLDVPVRERPVWNRVILHVRPVFTHGLDAAERIARRVAAATEGLGLETVLIHGLFGEAVNAGDGVVLRFENPSGAGLELSVELPPTEPLAPLDDYTQKVVECRRRGYVYVYEFVRMLTPGVSGVIPRGTFVELDLDTSGARLAPVDRPHGRNVAGVVVGLIRNHTRKHPEGMERVFVGGDPTRSLGAIAEDEARRIIAAIDLAEERAIPLEWFALSSGARISMDSGTENMDWIGRVLRRIVEFTQAGGEINVVVCGINVGAQPYWNAEATMLAHTKGILVMTPDSAMVLTGKTALDFSGGVSAEDNFGIGGYERIMGPNGEAQYWAPDLRRAAEILHRHYDHTYVVPGEQWPRRAPTPDPAGRDIRSAPHGSGNGSAGEFETVGDVFSEGRNADRKKPFDIRSVMRAVSDVDAEPLERWRGMDKADTAVVWDTHVGGIPLCMIGIESRPLVRQGFVPADGPDSWTSGTLFPQSSKKVSRALNSASGNRPAIILANLAGFDGSPESLRNLQLEYGAEIGRAVVNFDGPLVFCVVSRYHGGAFVVFSATLNDDMVVLALEGSKASVIGGAPAAAVVFSQEVAERVRTDDRVRGAEAALAAAHAADRPRLRGDLDDLRREVRSEKLGEVAAEFDAIHSIERARKVGSVHEIVAVRSLRPALVEAVERGLRR